jgi:hypothetical protein
MAVGSCGTPGIEHVELRHSALYPCAALEHERRPDACTARAASSWHTTGCTPFASTAFLVKLFLQAHPTLVAYSAGRRRRGSRANWASLSQGEAGRQQQQCQHAGGGGRCRTGHGSPTPSARRPGHPESRYSPDARWPLRHVAWESCINHVVRVGLGCTRMNTMSDNKAPNTLDRRLGPRRAGASSRRSAHARCILYYVIVRMRCAAQDLRTYT